MTRKATLCIAAALVVVGIMSSVTALWKVRGPSLTNRKGSATQRPPQPAGNASAIEEGTVDCGDGYSYHPACRRGKGRQNGVLLSNGKCVDCTSAEYAKSYPLSRYWLVPRHADDPPPAEARRMADGSYVDEYGHPWNPHCCR